MLLPVLRLLVVLITLLMLRPGESTAQSRHKAKAEAISKAFKTTNSGGRSGYYFLPKNYKSKALPLMLIFHGSNISGKTVVKLFKKLAKESNFIIAAPDSSNPMGWEVPDNFDSP